MDLKGLFNEGEREIFDSLNRINADSVGQLNEFKLRFLQSFDFIQKLINEINNLRHQILPFIDFEYVKCLKMAEVQELEKRTRVLWEFYQFQSVTRAVLKENNIKKELTSASKYKCLVDVENTEFHQFKEDFSQRLQELSEKMRDNQ